LLGASRLRLCEKEKGSAGECGYESGHQRRAGTKMREVRDLQRRNQQLEGQPQREALDVVEPAIAVPPIIEPKTEPADVILETGTEREAGLGIPLPHVLVAAAHREQIQERPLAAQAHALRIVARLIGAHDELRTVMWTEIERHAESDPKEDREREVLRRQRRRQIAVVTEAARILIVADSRVTPVEPAARAEIDEARPQIGTERQLVQNTEIESNGGHRAVPDGLAHVVDLNAGRESSREPPGVAKPEGHILDGVALSRTERLLDRAHVDLAGIQRS